MVILKSYKVNLTSYIFKRQKKHHVLKKGSIHQGDTAILSLYALDIEAPKPMKPKLAEYKVKIGSSTAIAEISIQQFE